ncbi:TPA_asm: hypothetical protein HUJ06_031959 [Nelumbo nucifera]|uniref:Uncharacterized protein n=1 Tax=Nelumbo nucifera TaxID=4432 RepID=A0A822ZWD6_NELNU|nr:TPA_asm: hypothetical protein HUJ06_031959 [Nelumbo nucifera]
MKLVGAQEGYGMSNDCWWTRVVAIAASGKLVIPTMFWFCFRSYNDENRFCGWCGNYLENLSVHNVVSKVRVEDSLAWESEYYSSGWVSRAVDVYGVQGSCNSPASRQSLGKVM